MTVSVPVPHNSLTISRTWRIALGIVGAISLLAMLAYPFGYDQAAFFIGGEMVVKHGAIPYRDLIDTKPPVIFYLYGLASSVLGYNTWGIRLLDIVWHVATALFLYKLLKRYLTEPLAFLSTFFYVVHYSFTGYWMTAQAETFAILPALMVISLALHYDERTVRNALLSGLLLTLIFLLKFTLIAFFVGVAIALLLSEKKKQALIYCSVASITFIGCVAAYLAYLDAVGALDSFLKAIEWVREYAAIQPLFDIGTISGEFKRKFPENMLRSYSITLTVIGLLGLGWIFVSKRGEKHSHLLLTMFALALGFSLLGIAYERKFFPYHYTRAYAFFAPFIALGLSVLLRYFIQYREKRTAILWLLPVLLFFSPLLHFFTQPLFWSYQWVTGKNREAIVQEKIEDYYAWDQRRTGEYLQSKMSDNDQLFFWGNGVGVYYFAHRLPTTFALTNTPFVTEWTSPEWKRELIDQLTKSNPTYIVVEWGDNRDYISGTNLDSYRLMVKWPELRDIVFNRYREEKRFGHFLVYRRID